MVIGGVARINQWVSALTDDRSTRCRTDRPKRRYFGIAETIDGPKTAEAAGGPLVA